MLLEHILAPTSVDAFFDNYWEAKHLHIPRRSPEHFSNLLTIEDLDSVLGQHALRTEDCRFSRESAVLMGSEAAFTNVRNLSNIVDPRRARSLFHDGWTIVLERGQRWNSAINKLCADLYESLNHHTQCNVYLSPPNCYGFGPHFDTHDVFVLQVHGRKKWRLYRDYIQLPLPSQATALPKPPEESTCIEIILEPGDTLYVPRGLVHDADSLEEASAHITLGLLSHTWNDLFATILRKVSLRNVDFRRSLPPGFLAGEGISGLKEGLVKLAAALQAEIRDTSLLDEFDDSVFTEGSNVRHTRGTISDIVLSHEIQLSSRLVLREGCCPFKVNEFDDKFLSLERCDTSVRFPIRVRDSVEFILNRATVVVNEIPGLDDDSKIVLCKRLVQERVMTVQQV